MTILELLQELNVQTAPEDHHHRSASSGFEQIECPYCSLGSGRFRMGVKPWVASCWTCGVHPLSETIALASGCSPSFVYRALGRLAKDFAPQRTVTHGKYVPPGLRKPLAAPHRRYLRKRNFQPDKIVKLWGIEGIGLHPRFSWTIFIPITYNGEAVSFTTRSIIDGVWAGYSSAKPEEEKIPHKELLYGEDYCSTTIVVVEGPLDVWAIGPGAVCTFGTQYTPSQLLKMSKYPRRVVMFDAEPEAQRVASRLCADLAAFDGTTTNVILESGKDASRAKKGEVKAVRQRFLC